jgi:abortive infection alpha-like protein
MTDPTSEAEAIARTAEALGLRELAPEVYRDLLQPATRECGRNLEKVAKLVGVALAPIDGVMWGVDRVKAVLATKVARIFEASGTTEASEPPLAIAGPLVMGMLFARDEEELQDLYAGLLASSMTEGKKGDAHPSFVAIIQQLTSVEVQLLDYLGRSHPPLDTVAVEEWPQHGRNERSKAVEQQILERCLQDGLAGVRSVHVENLVRLSLLQVTAGTHYNIPQHGGLVETESTTTDWRFIEFTELGDTFLRTCRPQLERPKHEVKANDEGPPGGPI